MKKKIKKLRLNLKRKKKKFKLQLLFLNNDKKEITNAERKKKLKFLKTLLKREKIKKKSGKNFFIANKTHFKYTYYVPDIDIEEAKQDPKKKKKINTPILLSKSNLLELYIFFISNYILKS